MGIDLQLLQNDKGGDFEGVCASQKKRFASEELVHEVLAMYKEWTKTQFDTQQLQKEVNKIQKDIGACMKDMKDAAKKEEASKKVEELKAQKADMDAKIVGLRAQAVEQETAMRRKGNTIGNIVHESVPVSDNEDNNKVERTFYPKDANGDSAPPVKGAGLTMKEGVLSHHEVMYRLGMLEMERGTKVAGHRGYYLVGDGVDLNQALITYGLDFLRSKEYKKVQPPFFMNKAMMGKTAQLEEFDEALYKLEGSNEETEKYLIATSEQPISAMHADEWFEKPSEQLPIKYAGYSTCFRKEAGSSGRDVLGVFRVHQFEKVEQFCITDPSSSWEIFDQMIANSEEFYQSLGLPYQLISIVSGALNNAAAKKYDLEAWFPHQGEYKELVSVSNCTDYQSRSLEVRCGIKKQGDTRKVYVHMLNGTLCATERALCCIVENYQTPEGVMIPEPMQKYMQGRTFLPYVRELPTTAAQKPAKQKH
ncbi:RHTO0S05e07316g1_1 [Rhodotorula toruloides]|uniref:serine--tRNA ligase n=1 Tax=Rhodotorula toruloides TaxID=5286 RepID=A0A061B197_RHOTO|nr:RHTO0S05e07316g1_1 [Rhodotorula toruloides]